MLQNNLYTSVDIAAEFVSKNNCPETLTIARGAAKKALLKVGAEAFVVFYEYLLEAGKGKDFSDKHIASQLGWSAGKVAQAREALTAANWFYEQHSVPIGRNKKQAPTMVHISLGLDDNPKLRLSTFRINSTEYYEDGDEEDYEE